jgi:ElaB/YqjD/DUF883 family membrane-anchored ribosome-binding protein
MPVQAFQVREHMPVVGSDGSHVGTVDQVEGDRIKLTKRDDPDGSGQHHHYIPLSMAASVDGGQVRLTVPGSRAREMAAGPSAAGVSEEDPQHNGSIRDARPHQSAAGAGQSSTDDLIGQVQERAGEMFDKARSRAESAARQAGAMAEDVYDDASAMAARAGSAARRTMDEQPMLALVVVGALGFALGLIAGSATRR